MSQPVTTAGVVPATPGSAALKVLAALLATLQGLSLDIKAAFVKVLFLKDGETARWGAHVPKLARVVADMVDLDKDGTLFAWLSYKAAELRQLEGEVVLLGEIQSFLSTLTDEVDALLAAKKNELYLKTYEAVDGVKAADASPLTPVDMKDRLKKVTKAVMDIVNDRKNTITTVKRGNKAKAEAQQAKVGRLEQENQILRGEVPPEATPPRRSRSKKR